MASDDEISKCNLSSEFRTLSTLLSLVRLSNGKQASELGPSIDNQTDPLDPSDQEDAKPYMKGLAAVAALLIRDNEIVATTYRSSTTFTIMAVANPDSNARLLPKSGTKSCEIVKEGESYMLKIIKKDGLAVL